MKRSKVIFLILSGLFFLLMAFFIYDFARRTTFPGSPGFKKKNTIYKDSIEIRDSTHEKPVKPQS